MRVTLLSLLIIHQSLGRFALAARRLGAQEEGIGVMEEEERERGREREKVHQAH
jgi:hypothetical protein